MSANPVDVLQSYDAPAQPAGENSGLDSAGPARPWLDKLGITASVACAVHCIAAPLLLLLLPAAGAVWSDPMVHWVLAVLVLPLAILVVYRGYRKHGKGLTLGAAVLGAGFIVAGLIAPMVSDRPLFTTPVPAFANLGPAAAPGHATPVNPAAVTPAACTEPCCPTVAVQQTTGAATLGFPAGGVLTIIGSVLLILAHATNLHACRCFGRVCPGPASPADTGCGCPA